MAIIKSVFWLSFGSFPSSHRSAEVGQSSTGMTKDSWHRGENSGSNPRSNILFLQAKGNNCKRKGRQTPFGIAGIWNLSPHHPRGISIELMIFPGKTTRYFCKMFTLINGYEELDISQWKPILSDRVQQTLVSCKSWIQQLQFVIQCQEHSVTRVSAGLRGWPCLFSLASIPSQLSRCTGTQTWCFWPALAANRSCPFLCPRAVVCHGSPRKSSEEWHCRQVLTLLRSQPMRRWMQSGWPAFIALSSWGLLMGCNDISISGNSLHSCRRGSVSASLNSREIAMLCLASEVCVGSIWSPDCPHWGAGWGYHSYFLTCKSIHIPSHST